MLFAYVCYSTYVHGRYRSRPGDAPAVALAFGAVLPDLIDKPLAWEFDVFSTGYAAAHSVFIGVPAVLAVYAIAERRRAGASGGAFLIGYVLHLVGDVLPASLSSGRLELSPVLWPIADSVPGPDRGSFVDGVYGLLTEYVARLLTLELTPVIALQLGSVVLGVALWLADGRPGLSLVTDPLRRGIDRLRA
ncbi:membrane-bound metal-dependent hydrolase [Halorubrum lipolyticum DSM 21995]|uniref:Membrane-bound metal-dependent hydrolase n=1 Tax=Halorubrum lipolyticum DSM 21995 TaxID=1227482 RepID=M0NNZ5_9EURY|nr:membrane-bound metal-dependent hydrolase [Halorubrum lipolyticum DSM 21995]